MANTVGRLLKGAIVGGVGVWLSKTMKAKDTTIAAFKMAIKNRPVIQPLIFHSDRGVQYACDKFRQEFKDISSYQAKHDGAARRQESQLLG